MKVLVDTNVILDALMGRKEYYHNADKIIKLCADKKVMGVLAAHTIPNLFYILRKTMDVDARRQVILDLCNIFDIDQIDKGKLLSAVQNRNFDDFEDCLQMECAASYHADKIITRNVKDFTSSFIPAVTPEDFLKEWELIEKE